MHRFPKIAVPLSRIQKQADMNTAITATHPVESGLHTLPDDIFSGPTYSHEEVWKMAEDILNAHYGTNFKLV
jgi:hypothetical protein